MWRAVNMGHNLSDVVADYLKSCSTTNKPSTVRNKRRSLDHFLTCVGNIQTRNITHLHVDTFFAAMTSRGHTPGSMNNHLFTLRHFFRWCGDRGYRPRGDDPTSGRRPWKQPVRDRLFIPREDFDRLLDAAEHPRDRIVVALGLYLFLRQGEIASLRMRDVDLAGRKIHVTVHKTGEVDDMPIARQLDIELRRWLSWYTADAGPLEPDFYLCPAKASPRFAGIGQRRLVRVETANQLRPVVKMQKIEKCATRALEACGYPIRDASGRSTMEGIHTLRRSGARALFDDRIRVASYDGVGRMVQSMLHHKNFTMTEHYLRIDLDRKRRDVELAGEDFFLSPDTTNVIELKREGAG